MDILIVKNKAMTITKYTLFPESIFSIYLPFQFDSISIFVFFFFF